MYTRTSFYADGLRWLGSIFNGAADRLDRSAAADAPLDPREYRQIEDYVNNVRIRAHLNS